MTLAELVVSMGTMLLGQGVTDPVYIKNSQMYDLLVHELGTKVTIVHDVMVIHTRGPEIRILRGDLK